MPDASDAGSWALTVTASNDAGMAVQHLVVSVTAVTPVTPATTLPEFLTASAAHATRGEVFVFRASAAGRPGPRLFAGSVPEWLKVTRLSRGRLKLHGTPKMVGTYSVVLPVPRRDRHRAWFADHER